VRTSAARLVDAVDHCNRKEIIGHGSWWERHRYK
jgi:hypothetical protein